MIAVASKGKGETGQCVWLMSLLYNKCLKTWLKDVDVQNSSHF